MPNINRILKGLILPACALLAVGVILWMVWPETPPLCATDISLPKAEVLFHRTLAEYGMASEDAGTFKLMGVSRDKSEDWPTYVAQFEGTEHGVHRVLAAIGNGCGLSEIVDLTPGMNAETQFGATHRRIY